MSTGTGVAYGWPARARERPVGPWRLGWRRLRHDRWGFASLVVVCAIVLLGLFGGAVVSRLVGHSGETQFPYAANAALRPAGPWSHVAALASPRMDDYGQILPPPAGAKTSSSAPIR